MSSKELRHPLRRAVHLVVLVAVLASASACTEGLSTDAAGDGDEAELVDGPVEAWPDPEVAATTSVPTAGDVSIEIHELFRSADGFTTLRYDVVNDSPEDLTMNRVFNYPSAGGAAASIFDPEGGVRYGAIASDGGSGCLCTSFSSTVPSRSSLPAYATFGDVERNVQKVRVELPGAVPVDNVPVVDVDAFVAAGHQPLVVETDEDLRIDVDRIAPTDDGYTLLELTYRNDSSPEPIPFRDFPTPDDLSLVDAEAGSVYSPLRAPDGSVVETVPDRSETLARGDEARVRILFPALPDSTDMLVRGSGVRRSFPVEPSATTDDGPTAPSDPDDERIETMTTPNERFDDDFVPMARAEKVAIDETGPELVGDDLPDVVETVTSPAEPGWEIGVRGVLRGPGPWATLVLDIDNTGSDDIFPAGMAQGVADDLSGIRVIDPDSGTAHGVVADGSDALSADEYVHADPGDDYTGWAVVSGLDPSARSVSVDLPGFGTVDDVPVVAGPSRLRSPGAEKDDEDPDDEDPGDEDPGDEAGEDTDTTVAATTRVVDSGDLRTDVLAVEHLGGGNGTLLRLRSVNEGAPDAESAPFGSLCQTVLVDPETGDAVRPLDPCLDTPWEPELSTGEQVVSEVRFPTLPDDLDAAVVLLDHSLPTVPVPLTEGAPWYLSLPAPRSAQQGKRYVGQTSEYDGVTEVVEDEGDVEVTIDTDVLFGFDDASLTDDARTRVTDVAKRLADDAAPGTVTITGHTDAVGDETYNQTLSEQRAAAVRDVLADTTGRTDLDFTVEGVGASEPVAPDEIDGRDNPDGRARNRRVTIVYEAR